WEALATGREPEPKTRSPCRVAGLYGCCVSGEGSDGVMDPPEGLDEVRSDSIRLPAHRSLLLSPRQARSQQRAKPLTEHSVSPILGVNPGLAGIGAGIGKGMAMGDEASGVEAGGAERILTAAVRLFGERGVAATSLKSVAADAG